MPARALLNPFSDKQAVVADRDDWAITVPLGIVGSCVFVSALSSVYSTQWLAGALPNPTLVYVIGAVTASVIPVAVWGGVSFLVYVGAVFTAVEGQFRQAAWIVGAGMTPYLLSTVIGFIASVVAISGVAPPETTAEVARKSRLLNQQTIVQAANYLHIGFLLWCGLDWIDMITTAWDGSQRQSAVIVGVPLTLVVGVYAALTLA